MYLLYTYLDKCVTCILYFIDTYLFIFFRDILLRTFDIQSVDKNFFTPEKVLKPINGSLWCLKCIGKLFLLQ